MKSVLLIIMSFCYSQVLIAQENKKNFDFIISIDEDIVKVISKPQIIVKNVDNILETIQVSYHPGNISFNEKDFENLLLLKQELNLYLKFDYYDYSVKGVQEIYNYEIAIGKNWFEQSYVILKIYNTSKKMYKRKLKPLEGKNYTFDLDTSNGQMIRIRKSK